MGVSNGGRLVYFLVFRLLGQNKNKIETLTLNLQSEAGQPVDAPSVGAIEFVNLLKIRRAEDGGLGMVKTRVACMQRI